MILYNSGQGRRVPGHHRDRAEHGRGRRPGKLSGGERRGRLQGLLQLLRRAGEFDRRFHDLRVMATG